MIVNSTFKRQLLAGELPALTDPDVYEAQVIVIEREEDGHPTVWITVGQRVKADVRAYVLHDHRPHLLNKTGSGYTDLHGRAIGARDANGPEPEALTETQLTKITKEAHLRDAERRSGEEKGRQDARRLGHSLRDLAIKAARSGVDPTIVLAPIKRQIDNAAAELDQAA